MSVNFKDRVSTYPNRYLVTPENGTAYYVTLERADEPTTMGTPLNAATMNKLAALTDLEKLPDMHIWKKFEGDPSLTNETAVTDEKLVSKVAISGISYDNLVYADSIVVAEGAITLVNPTTIVKPERGSLTNTLGKYVCLSSLKEATTYCYYIPEDATFSEVKVSGTLLDSYELRVDSATKITSNKYLNSPMNENRNAYPDNSIYADDGYWYVYHKRFGDCNGNITDEQIAQVVTDYLKDNPATGVNMTQVNNAIDAAIGNAIGGTY